MILSKFSICLQIFRGVKWESVAKKGKYAMETFTFKLGDQKSMMNLTQFYATIWAKHNVQWWSNEWKIMTLF